MLGGSKAHCHLVLGHLVLGHLVLGHPVLGHPVLVAGFWKMAGRGGWHRRRGHVSLTSWTFAT
jgi:hypothetical protein